LKKNKLLYIILGFIFSPLVANATNKTDWVQGFKLTKEEILFIEKEKLFIECEEYEYSYFKPEKCLSNYNRFRNNKNLSYNHWSPSISKNDWGRYRHSSHPKSFKGWNKNYEKNKPYLYLK